MRTGGNGGKVLFGIVVCVLGVLGYFLVLPVAIHDYQLWRSGRSLDALSHPPGTARVKNYSRVGLLFGNGNHTDFWIKEIRSFQGDFLPIQKHYEKQEVIFPNGKSIVPEVFLLAKDQGGIPYDLQESREWKDLLLASSSLYSITVTFQTGPEGDYRSH